MEKESSATISMANLQQSVQFLVSNCFLKLGNSIFKGILSGLRQFLAAESPLKMMKNVFYFISKARFVLKIFKFFS